ncbi:response regulator transcription factor [Undibacterium sp. RTI2.1]|uniref:response regulator transcription factor n=1 Tax=unclassified Undibacterium TaxID=2630295 RepID=UPI002B2325CF|nr:MULTISPECIES: response regulator transcription factor [unclassified Undibacterium]MEB0032967.1 response regulator transcription factor [Undibacterium sp. RTI2.1]MEB0118726.1 response regulator transcription factor [Undibacterium sp. RTI2.2]
MESSAQINVLLADDQQLLLLMYKQVLEGFGMNIVGMCKSPADVEDLYKKLRPHVVLLDIRFGGDKTGFDAMQAILEFDERANIVVISQFDLGPYISRAYALGARSFLTKDCEPETLCTAVKMASIGKRYHMPAITEKVMDLLTNPDPDPKAVLSQSDFEIFMLLAEGKTNAEIASEKGLQIGFVSTHRQKIQDLLKIDRPQQFSRLAIRHGLLDP